MSSCKIMYAFDKQRDKMKQCIVSFTYWSPNWNSDSSGLNKVYSYIHFIVFMNYFCVMVRFKK